MTFLNPIVLLGLIAAAIPILLHLFNLRKLKRIEFSTLAFLKELQKTKIRRLKLRQLLLLVLRTLLIVLIVTAFSRPTVKGSGWGNSASHARTTAVLIIDDSYSMTSIEQGGQLLQQAKEEAAGILSLMREGDEVFLVRVSAVSPGEIPQRVVSVKDFAAAGGEIKAMNPSFVHRTIENALRYSAKLMVNARNINKEVYVFSDFQRGCLQNGIHSKQAESIFPIETRFFFLPVGRKTRQNLGIESARVQNAIFAVGKPFTLRVKVANWGSQDVQNELLSVYLNGTRVAQKALDIQSQNNSQTDLSLAPTSSGYIDGMVELQDDDLEFDNRRYFAIFIPERLNVLLVGNPADLRYVKLALGTSAVEGESAISLQESTIDGLTSHEIDRADVVVFSNVREMNAPQKARIASFVESGGGIVYFPGSKTDSASFFSTWADNLKIAPITSVLNVPSQSNQAHSALGFDKVDYRHPIFEGMFLEESVKREKRIPQNQSRVLESPEIHSLVQYHLRPQSNAVITLSDGSPFLIEEKVKKGTVLMYCVSAGSDWSDFPLKGLFVPLLHRSVAYVANEQSLMNEVTAGDETIIPLGKHNATRVTVQNPEKVDIVANTMKMAGGNSVHFQEATIPGIYSIRSDDELLKQFIVSVDPSESNTVRADNANIESMLLRLGVAPSAVKSIDQRADMRQAIIQSRVGLELWKYFVVAAFLIGLIELLVGRSTKRDRA